ncbi:hypothetical protein PTW35_08430 [Photobacterium sp. DA100]|uniref:hypothetical protein n=1 Tax=Photobacterium sp. DA100 TaxID=3027472 RepID=UPI002479E55D|nr:hypothetical protein [Photobacterium sp. DA100]WEM43789.1 hypothetical protein PTW35_08430 [Photobacterium sp. DA100]
MEVIFLIAAIISFLNLLHAIVYKSIFLLADGLIIMKIGHIFGQALPHFFFSYSFMVGFISSSFQNFSGDCLRYGKPSHSFDVRLQT